MNVVSPSEGLTLLLLFGAGMIALVWFKTHAERSADGFLVADREVSIWNGAFSIAVSWIWAPAIFICSLQAFTKGLPGIFWFTLPNILCFFVFAPFAVRIRKLMPAGYTLPQAIQKRFQDKKTHLAFLVVFFGYQFGAIIINALAGGTLLHAVSGININVAIVGMSVIALSYSLLGGLKASVFTDVIQMFIILIVALVLIPLCLFKTGGLSTLSMGLSGVDGAHGNLFDPWIAFAMGIPMTVSLLAGPFGDQMFWQRAFAVREDAVKRTFIYGGILFGVVPIVLSLLGFIGAALVREGAIEVSDPQMVAPLVIAYLLPKAAVYVFCLMAFAGLCSTMDSALCAASSLGTVDIYKRYFNPNAEDHQILRLSRWFMLLTAVAGTGVALLQPKLLWVFLSYGALASAGLFPTVLALCWKRLSANGAFWAVSLSILLGTPLSIYANVKEDPYLIVVASVLGLAVGLLVCLVSGLKNKSAPYDFSQLSANK